MSYTNRFFHYALPSIGALLVTGLYFVVDGIFVGQGVGSNGLAAVNLAVPYISILTAITTMIAMGGATLASIALGAKQQEKAAVFFNTSIFSILSVSVIFLIITFIFLEKITFFLGANEILLESTMTYIKYYVSFDIFFASSLALATFVRNDGAPRLAFWSMILGAASNIFLDWLFIFVLQMGIKGAAVATGLGQILSCVLLLHHFIRRQGELYFSLQKINIRLIPDIFKTGLPECITQMSSPVTIFCYNLIIIEMLGEKGVAAYSIVSYLLIIVFAVFIGIAEGLQPLLSRSYGERNYQALGEFFKVGLKTNLGLSLVIYVSFLIFGKTIINIFTDDEIIVYLAYSCICIYGLSFLLASLNIVYTTFFLATRNTKLAVKIALLRSIVFNSLCIFGTAYLLGEQGIWFGIVAVELMVILYLYAKKLFNLPLLKQA